MDKMIRDAATADFPAILALNTTWVQVLSPLDAAGLTDLHEMSAYHRVVESDGEVAAFLLALREGAAYTSPNYRWFADRHDVFIYIDRIVVDTARQRGGHGRALYDDLIAFARTAGVGLIVSEFDTEPPNEMSRRFHAGFGFREVGIRDAGAGKRVSMQALRI